VEPLLLDLGIIGTQQEQFDQLATGLYQLPQDAPNNAKQLLPLLERPAEITDCPCMITPEQHRQGWMKAKESTSLSLSGVHFSHYKASAMHKLINKLHMLLADIPLQIGFSYCQWKKGINVMLENLWETVKLQNYVLSFYSKLTLIN